MLWLGVCALLISLCISGTQQQVGTCTLEDQISFTLNLTGGLVCGVNLRSANNTPTTLQGMQGLDGACIAGCAGAITDWLLSPACNDPIGAGVFTIWCLPADGARIPRCQLALYPYLDEDIFMNDNMRSCTTFGGGMVCPAGCAVGLSRMADEIGCCFQHIYNTSSSDIPVSDIPAPPEIPPLLELLSNPMLWDACEVNSPNQCTRPPFPQEAIMTATEAQSNTVVYYLSATSLLLGLVFSRIV